MPAMDPAPVLAPLLFVTDLFMRQLPTLGSGITRAVVPTALRLIGMMTTPSRMDSFVCRFMDNKGGCAYRFATYRDDDYAVQDGLVCVQIHGVGGGPGIRPLTGQLQRDASNLSVLDQYALSLHGTASDMLELVIGRHDFPSAAMDTATPVPRFHTHGGYGPMAPSARPWWACSGLRPSGPSV